MKRRGQGVVHVKDLFAKYAATLKAPQKSVIKAFVDVVQDTIGYTLKPEQCAYGVHNRTITLTVSGVIKTEILFKKKKILDTLKATLGERNAPTNIL